MKILNVHNVVINILIRGSPVKIIGRQQKLHSPPPPHLTIALFRKLICVRVFQDEVVPKSKLLFQDRGKKSLLEEQFLKKPTSCNREPHY
jgi:hypothetical protein